MIIKLQHSVQIDHPAQIVFPAMSEFEKLAALQFLATRSNAQVTRTAPDDHVLARLSENPEPLTLSSCEGTIPDSVPRTRFDFVERFKIAPFLPEQVTKLSAAQIVFPMQMTVVFQSRVHGHPITDLKRRECLETTDQKTIVKETVWVTAPWYLALFLKVTGLAQSTLESV